MTSYELSDPLGTRAPRIQHRPLEPRTHSAGQEAIDLAASAGLVLDPWQCDVVDHILSMREDNSWCAKEAGICVSRQNGKGSIIEALELWGLFVNEEQIFHTAHVFKTALEGFRRIEALIQRTPELRAECKRIVRNHGEEGIELYSGARLQFGTRTKGGTRGLTLDRVFCDEAMYLNDDHMSAILPTVSARPNPQILYLGSAGTQESTYFGRVRARGVKGDDPRLYYAEWSIDGCTDFCTSTCTDHDRTDTPSSYAKANPGLGIRITVEHVESERRSMGEDEFNRERLGIGDWPIDGDRWAVIGEASWNAREDSSSEIVGRPFVIAVDTTPDRGWTCISACGGNAHEQTHVEMTSGDEEYDHRPGTKWVVPRLLQLWHAHKPEAVVIDSGGQAATFIAELEEAGVEILTPKAREYAQGCGDFYSGIVPRKGNEPYIVHLGQQPLTNAVAGADKRDLADMWAWSKKLSSTDISPLASCTLAAWGYKKLVYEKPKAATPWIRRR